MPMKWANYPPNWAEMAKACKDAAGWRCDICGIAHGTLRQTARGRLFHEIVTAAHANQQDTRNPEALLFCLCTRCHLDYDREYHLAKIRVTLRRKRTSRLLLSGQLPLFL